MIGHDWLEFLARLPEALLDLAFWVDRSPSLTVGDYGDSKDRIATGACGVVEFPSERRCVRNVGSKIIEIGHPCRIVRIRRARIDVTSDPLSMANGTNMP